MQTCTVLCFGNSNPSHKMPGVKMTQTAAYLSFGDACRELPFKSLCYLCLRLQLTQQHSSQPDVAVSILGDFLTLHVYILINYEKTLPSCSHTGTKDHKIASCTQPSHSTLLVLLLEKNLIICSVMLHKLPIKSQEPLVNENSMNEMFHWMKTYKVTYLNS